MPNDATPSWSIGELAAAAGTTPRTIRHYEDQGLLPTPPRTPAGHRRYDAATVGRLYRIVALRELGVSLEHIAAVINHPDENTALRDAATRQLALVDQQLAAAGELRRRLLAITQQPTVDPTLLLEATRMTIRLDTITTRRGDDGTTTTPTGTTRKDDARIEALGAIDDLNAVIGIATTHADAAPETAALLATAQQHLFDLGADIAQGTEHDHSRISQDLIDNLTAEITQRTQAQEPLTSFLIPGGGPLAAHLHHCRTATRTAERRVVTAVNGQPTPAIVYLNRLSDLFFVLARDAATTETHWAPEQPT